MEAFLSWLNAPPHPNLPPLLKAGLGHLWLVTLHPFDDGNGRIARAVGDLLLARADGSSQRFYSLSAAIQRDRKGYYHVLEQTQRQDLDVTAWLLWFLHTLHLALEQALHSLEAVLHKAYCWQVWALLPLNARQIKVLNRLLDGFEGKLSSSKYAALAKCSSDTALRDLQSLLALGVLRATAGGGRSVGYEVAI
jgi:Fic family protein